LHETVRAHQTNTALLCLLFFAGDHPSLYGICTVARTKADTSRNSQSTLSLQDSMRTYCDQHPRSIEHRRQTLELEAASQKPSSGNVDRHLKNGRIIHCMTVISSGYVPRYIRGGVYGGTYTADLTAGCWPQSIYSSFGVLGVYWRYALARHLVDHLLANFPAAPRLLTQRHLGS
jgi:hypothetical protein